MKPRKLKTLYELLSTEEDPEKRVILKGLIKLFEWHDKMLEIYPVIEFGSDILETINKYPEIREYGYFYSFSKNYNVNDISAWKNETLEVSDDEAIRDVFEYAMMSSCAYIRDLAYIYREREDVRKLVNEIIETTASNAREKHSWINILSRGWFMSDFQRETLQNIIIREHQGKV